MANNKSGIYLIECRATGKSYVGSSKQIYGRWAEHRRTLGRGKSGCLLLQYAWTKYGEAAFRFSVLEECPNDELEVREQHYIDTLRPVLNCITDVKRRYSAEARAKMAALCRQRAALITHCPRGHEYTDENTYRNAKGKRICKACNALRVAGVYANETPEQRETRMALKKANYENNRERYLKQTSARQAGLKAEKREYDRLRRERLKQWQQHSATP